MTEYEMLYMTQVFLGNGMTDMLNFFSVLTAYLVAGYLAAHRLSFSMSVFATAAFVVFSVNAIIVMVSIGRQLQALLDHMHLFAQAGKGLDWNPVVAGPPPNLWIAGTAALALMLVGVIGSIYFFYQCRRSNHKAEAGPWHPKV